MRIPTLRAQYFRSARMWLRLYRVEHKPHQFNEAMMNRRVANLLPPAPTVYAGEISVWKTRGGRSPVNNTNKL